MIRFPWQSLSSDEEAEVRALAGGLHVRFERNRYDGRASTAIVTYALGYVVVQLTVAFERGFAALIVQDATANEELYREVLALSQEKTVADGPVDLAGALLAAWPQDRVFAFLRARAAENLAAAQRQLQSCQRCADGLAAWIVPPAVPRPAQDTATVPVSAPKIAARVQAEADAAVAGATPSEGVPAPAVDAHTVAMAAVPPSPSGALGYSSGARTRSLYDSKGGGFCAMNEEPPLDTPPLHPLDEPEPERMIVHVDALRAQILTKVAALTAAGGPSVPLGAIVVVFYEDAEVVGRLRLRDAIDFLDRDICHDAAGDWRGADTVELEIAP